MSLQKLSLSDAVDQALRRVEEGNPFPKPVFNFSNNGPLALNGVLPVILPDKGDFSVPHAARALGFNPLGIFQPREVGSSLGGSSVVTNEDFFREELSCIYEQYVREALKIYSATLGLRFEFNVSLADLAYSDLPAAVAFGSVNVAGANEYSAFNNGLDGSVEQFDTEGYTFFISDEGVLELSRIVVDPLFGKSSQGIYGDSVYADYAFSTFVHEFGHSLGLLHPGTYNGDLKSLDELIWLSDSTDESIMSYVGQKARAEFGLPYSDSDLSPITPRVVDFLALNRLYASQETSDGMLGDLSAFLGDTTYGFNSTISPDVSEVYAEMAGLLGENKLSMTLADFGGVDTIDLSGYENKNALDLTVLTGEEYESRFSMLNGTKNNLSLAVGTVIENAIGGRAGDTFWDNAADNVFKGLDGDDRFYLTSGSDAVDGGRGFDAVLLAGGRDEYSVETVASGSNAGLVTVASVTDPAAFVATLTSIEQLIFQADGVVLDL